jgi:hypothetical protein
MQGYAIHGTHIKNRTYSLEAAPSAAGILPIQVEGKYAGFLLDILTTSLYSIGPVTV